MQLKFFLWFLFSFHLSQPANAQNNTGLEYFSYCSNGACRMINGEFFQRMRGMPLDLNVHCKKNNHYALTFDDGPSANLQALLQTLERHQVKATFFLVGGNIKSQESIAALKDAYSKGHFLANHTLNHADLTSLPNDQILMQVEESRQAILKAIFPTNSDSQAAAQLKISTKYIRPPYGNINLNVDQVLKQAGYTSVRWSSDRYDWQLPNDASGRDLINKRVAQHLDLIAAEVQKGTVFNHSIIDLNHEGQTSTLQALETMIPLIKSRGYSFVTLSECLGE